MKERGERKEGVVEEALPSLLFRIKTDSGNEILAHLAGRLRMYHIRIVAGDRVVVELSPYDKKRGRIIRRL